MGRRRLFHLLRRCGLVGVAAVEDRSTAPVEREALTSCLLAGTQRGAFATLDERHRPIPPDEDDAPWPDADAAWSRVLRIQTKLHQWAIDDPNRRFDDLYNLVWSEPVQKLAKRYCISDRGLARVCERHRIPAPARGWWAKVAAGQRPSTYPYRPWFLTASMEAAAASGSRYSPPRTVGFRSASRA